VQLKNELISCQLIIQKFKKVILPKDNVKNWKNFFHFFENILRQSLLFAPPSDQNVFEFDSIFFIELEIFQAFEWYHSHHRYVWATDFRFWRFSLHNSTYIVLN